MSVTAGSRLLLAHRAGALIAATILLAGCVTTGGVGTSAGATNSPAAPGPSGSSGSSGSAASPATPAGTGSASGFYLRVWQTQALPLQETFGWLPSESISDGKFIDGMIAIPTIYPGPIYIGLSSKSISAAGVASIVAEARKDGLVGTTRDFAPAMPGSILGHIQMVIEGVTYDLTGPLPADAHTTTTEPGTSDAFTAFWNKLSNLSTWLGAELGASTPYDPERLAVMTIPPVAGSAGLAPNEKAWPLPTNFASFGKQIGSAGDRCAVVSGAELGTLLPILQSGNGLTQFIDSAGVKKSVEVRVLMPREPAPC